MDTQRPVGQRPAGARASLVSRLNLYPRLASLSTLRLPAYRYLVLSAALNSMANESRLMAQAWLLLALTNSDGWVGLVAGLPALLAAATAPLGGVFADRGERRRMLMLVRLGLAATALLTALLVGGDLIRVWHLLALALLIALLDVSGMTAGQTMIIDAVPRDELFNANALFSAAMNLALVIGPAIAGVILARTNGSYAFAFSTALYIGSALAASRIRVEQQRRDISATTVWSDLKGGVDFVRETPVLQWLMWIGMSGIAVGVWFALVPRFARDVLESGAIGYGAILSARGIGGLVGVTMLLLAGRVQRIAVVLVGCMLGFALLVTLFALSTSMMVATAAAFGLGIIFVWYPSTLRTAFQFSAGDAMRGRVMSLFSLLAQLLGFGWLVGGALSVWLGPQPTMILCALLALSVHILAYLKSADLRTLGRSST
jgi:predicted MFS family arabinose efflux permease